MIPQLVIAQLADVREKYISDFIASHSIPDYYVFHIIPEKKELSIDQIRGVNRQLIHQRKDPQLFVLHNFDNASQEAQNAMLKTLEEKSTHHYFILLVEDVTGVLPTILSRTQTIRLEKPVLSHERADIKDLLTTLISAKTPSILASSHISGMKADAIYEIIDQIILFFRSRLESDTNKASYAIKETLRIKALLQYNNLNPQLALDNLLLQIHKVYRLGH